MDVEGGQSGKIGFCLVVPTPEGVLWYHYLVGYLFSGLYRLATLQAGNSAS